MANIVIMVTTLTISDNEQFVQITGISRVEGASGEINWKVNVPWNSIPSLINSNIVDAALAEAAANGYTIAETDKKVLLGGVT